MSLDEQVQAAYDAKVQAAVSVLRSRYGDRMAAEIKAYRERHPGTQLADAALFLAAQVAQDVHAAQTPFDRLYAQYEALRAERDALAAEAAALRQAGQAVLAEHDARAAYIAAGAHNAPDGALWAAMAAHEEAERQIDAAALALRAAGFDTGGEDA